MLTSGCTGSPVWRSTADRARVASAVLYVCVKTVEYHPAQIYVKLGITSRPQPARYAEVFAEPAAQPPQVPD